jgi:hypothetical protein
MICNIKLGNGITVAQGVAEHWVYIVVVVVKGYMWTSARVWCACVCSVFVRVWFGESLYPASCIVSCNMAGS